MQIHDVTKLAGAHRRRKRVGRGCGSGRGKTSTRGHNGGGSRAGWRQRGLAEGGQMPTFRRLPKRGFSNARFRKEYTIVNVGDLEARFESGQAVGSEQLLEAGLIRKKGLPVKVLGDGDLTIKLVVEAAKFSRSASEKIVAVGGEAKIAGRQSGPVAEVDG